MYLYSVGFQRSFMYTTAGRELTKKIFGVTMSRRWDLPKRFWSVLLDNIVKYYNSDECNMLIIPRVYRIDCRHTHIFV